MSSLKHVGRVINTGRRCVVVFREIYDDAGKVIDENNCLVFESETLPDAEHQDLMRIVESEPAQSSSEIYNVLARTRLGNGMSALTWLANTQRLRKYPTDNIELTPDSRTSLKLNKLNTIVKMQKAGSTQEQINNALQDDTDDAPREATTINQQLNEDNPDTFQPDVNPQTGEAEVLNDSDIAKSYISQAEIFEAQAAELRKQAYELDENLAPKKRTTRKSANKKS